MNRISTGIAGLDELLYGGFIPGGSSLVRGGPGTGKTTLGFHYLSEGALSNEKSLFITLTESRNTLLKEAMQTGFYPNAEG